MRGWGLTHTMLVTKTNHIYHIFEQGERLRGTGGAGDMDEGHGEAQGEGLGCHHTMLVTKATFATSLSRVTVWGAQGEGHEGHSGVRKQGEGLWAGVRDTEECQSGVRSCTSDTRQGPHPLPLTKTHHIPKRSLQSF